MPRRCSVFGCRSNYDNGEAVSTFSLPRDEALKAQWLKKIPTDFSKLKHPIVCTKHFREEDIMMTDIVPVKGVLKTFPRKIPKLKEGALPCIFPNVPHYLSQGQHTARRLIDAEKNNLEDAIKNSLITHKEYLQKDSITCLKDIYDFFETKIVTGDKWTLVKCDNKVILCLIVVKGDIPNIVGNITVYENLKFSMFLGKVRITKFPFLKGKLDKLQSCNVLEQLLNFIEQLGNGNLNCKNVSEAIIDSAVELLKLYPNFAESENLNFIVEQLQLCQVSRNNARYRDKTMLFSSTLYIHSPSAYNALQKCRFLFLPHPRNLQKLICDFSITNHCIDGSISYLKTRVKYLQQHELLVCLNIDEIYMQPRISFKGGSVYGTSAFHPQKAAKTAQVFMLSSIFSKYRDVVCIVPVLNLTSIQLHTMILNILKEVENIGFKVLAVVSDNNSVNRRSFELFTPDKILKPYIQHPYDSSRMLFFIFDTVHIFKCIRNNWQNKKDCEGSLCFIDMENDHIICKAKYKHLENLYEIEKNSLAKFGHLLSYKVLYPSSIQKQNVKLALKLINERNIAALKHISKYNPDLFTGIEETIKFMEIIINWWKIVSVKSVYEADRFNDVFREAIKPTQNFQIEFLQKMCAWLKRWRLIVPSTAALSPQTFQSLIVTNEAFLELIPYVFRMYGNSYILLSKFQNDSLESRFSTYRQLSGSNYYISYTEILENEKKIRFRNAVILSSEQVDVPLKTLIPSPENHHDVDIHEFSEIINETFCFEFIPKHIIPVLVYIGGFTTFRILKESNCDLCINWLQYKKELNVEDEINDFTLDLDRGKLRLPKNCVVVSVGIVWHVMNNIFEKFLIPFMKISHQLSLLIKISLILLNRESENYPFKELCLCNHTLLSKLESIILIASKIFINNLVKSLNDKENFNKQNDKCKIKKLCK